MIRSITQVTGSMRKENGAEKFPTVIQSKYVIVCGSAGRPKKMPHEIINETKTLNDPRIPADFLVRYFLKKLISRNPKSGETGMSQARLKKVIFDQNSPPNVCKCGAKVNLNGRWKSDECIAISGYWLGTKLWCGKYLELDNVVVKSSNRGSGAGKLIQTYLEKKAQEMNCNIMVLDAYANNYKAHRFYYNQGYAPKGFHFIKMLPEGKIT